MIFEFILTCPHRAIAKAEPMQTGACRFRGGGRWPMRA
jgi:hypothetical protein